MAIGLTVLGLSSFEANTPLVPDPVQYDTIELFGAGIFDDLWGRNEIIDESVIDTYNENTYLPEWTPTTYVLGQFEGNLNMGNISGITAPLEGWRIYRKDPDRTTLRFLKEVSDLVSEYKDYQPVIEKEYGYHIFAKTANELSNPIISDKIIPNYYGHFIIDVDNEVSYKFDIETTTASFNTEQDFTEYQTNLEYNSYSVGNRKFKTGSISAIVRNEFACSEDCVEGLNQTIDILDALEEFITRTISTKYLKTRRGEIYKVFTHNYSQFQLNDNIREQVYVSSFNFKEDGDVYDN